MATDMSHGHHAPNQGHDVSHGHVLHPNEHPELHEHADVSIKGLVWTLIIFVVVGLATAVMVYFMFEFLETQAKAKDVAQTGLTGANTKIDTPEPRVQGVPGFHTNVPAQDTVEMKKQVAARLNGYTRLPESGYIAIPIERAKEIALGAEKQRLFPARQSAGAAAPASGGQQQQQAQPQQHQPQQGHSTGGGAH